MKSADHRTSCHRQLPFVLILSCACYCDQPVLQPAAYWGFLSVYAIFPFYSGITSRILCCIWFSCLIWALSAVTGTQTFPASDGLDS